MPRRGRTPIKTHGRPAYRDLRTRRGWSQEQLGFKSGLLRNYIGGIERGERNVEVVNLHRLTSASRLRLHDLLP
jgi:transcriptional regulator with XRE-family HTH domain